MKIPISELYRHWQSTDFPVAYCFDRKTYTVCEISCLEEANDEPYQRYLPLLQIDRDKIEERFIESFNDRQLLYKYKKDPNFNFHHFVESQGWWWDRWWGFKRKVIFDLQREWCEEHHIQYVYDL